MFELVENTTGNLVGEYDSQEEALEVVRRAVEQHGEEAVATLSLNHEGARGRVVALACGRALARLAARHQHVAVHAMDIRPNSPVNVRTADDQVLPRWALTGVVAGGFFPVVWVCRFEELEAARAEGREPESVPFPAEDVWPAETAATA